MKTLSKQDLHDILLGAAIVGTGGGGSLNEGLDIVDKALEDGFTFSMENVNNVPDEALVGTPYSCGSIGSLSQEEQRRYDALDKIDTTSEVAAVKAAEVYFDKKFYGVIATELGGLNTAVALEAAARLGIPLIDADPIGRSVPCLQHTTYYLDGISIAPMALVNKFGDTMIITDVASDERAEAIARAVAVASFNHVGIVDHVTKWHIVKNSLIPYTISMCLDIGQIARKAKAEKRNYAKDIADAYDGAVIFKGTITACDWQDEKGFTFSDLEIKGTGEYEGDTFKVWIQNENIMSWKNGKVFVTVPDSINIVNDDLNMPLLNPNATIGMHVTVFALKAFDMWRTKKGIEVLGPKFFGYNCDYTKLEDLIK